MSHTSGPYKPPLAETKLTAGEVSDIKHRDIAVFVLLNFVTMGIYWFYLCYCWAKEINGLEGRVKYQPAIVLLASIVTCGIAGLVFEILYAIDVGQATEARGVPGRMEQLAAWVVGLNVVAMLASATGIGVVIGLPLGILASGLASGRVEQTGEYARDCVMTTLHVHATRTGRVVKWAALKRGQLVDASRLGSLFFTTTLPDVITDLIDFCQTRDKNCCVEMIVPNGPTRVSMDLAIVGRDFKVVCSRRLVRGLFPLNPLAAEFGGNYDVVVTIESGNQPIQDKIAQMLRSKYSCREIG